MPGYLAERRALFGHSDVCDGTPDAALERRRGSRIVDDQPIDYCI
jgi:hypothetical protein